MKKKITAACLAGVLTLTGTAPVMASEVQNAVEKTETVRVQAQADGTASEITVSSTLKSTAETGQIQDTSVLEDIKNTEGDEEFTRTGDTVLWQNKGEPIAYEGKSTKELPVDVKVTYFLDGEEKKPSEMAGVSGEIKIRFEYENHISEEIEKDGKTVDVKTPFTVISAVMLPEEHFKNVEIINGKVIENDGQAIAAGMAFPGLADSLMLGTYEPTEEIEIPDYVEVTAEAFDFELEFTATIITPGVFADMELENLDDVEELTDGMNELTDASSQLSDGLSALSDGMKTFHEYLGEFETGANTLNEGAAALSEGLSQLDAQREALEQGAVGLSEGLTNLKNAISQVPIPDTSMDLDPLFTAVEMLNQDAQAVSANLKAVTDVFGLAGNSLAQIDLTKTEQAANAIAVQQAKTAAETAAAGAVDGLGMELTDEQKQEIKNAVVSAVGSSIEGSIDTSGASAENQAEITAVSQNLMNEAENADAGIAKNLSATEEMLNDMQIQVGTIAGYAEEIGQLAKTAEGLSAALEQLNMSVEQLTAGSGQLAEGIKAYSAGVGQASTGASALKSGTNDFVAAGSQLNTGFSALIQGTDALNTGMITFDQEGMKNLSKLAGNELTDIVTRAKALKQADENYDNYSGITEGTKGSVRFIVETEEIKK